MYSRLRPFDFERPTSIDDALLTYRQAADPVYLAGATALIPAWRLGTRRQASTVISLAGVLSRFVGRDTDGLHLGAGAPVASVLRKAGSRRDALGDALGLFATPQVCERATIGGNLAWAAPDSGLAPSLMALGSVITYREAGGVERLPVASLFETRGGLALPAGALLTGMIVPAPAPRSASAYVRLTSAGTDGPQVVSAAVSLAFDASGSPWRACVALGNAGPAPIAIEILAEGPGLREFCARALEAALAGASLTSDLTASSGYRRQMLRVVVRRALNAALRRHLGGGHDHEWHRPDARGEWANRTSPDRSERDAAGGPAGSAAPDGGESLVRGRSMRIMHRARRGTPD